MPRFFLVCFFIAITLFLSLDAWAADPPLPVPVGRVIWIKGTFKAIMRNNEERTLQKMSVIYEHDLLETGKGSQAQIAFSDNSLMTFSENSKFSIESYINASKSKKPGVGKFVVNLITGGFRTITGLIAKQAPDNYQSKTPVATIGVRGTEYDLRVIGGKTFIKRISGKPTITSGCSKKGEPCGGMLPTKPPVVCKIKGNCKTLVLDEQHPYAMVDSADMPPRYIDQYPSDENLVIINTTIDPFPMETIEYAPGKSQGNQPITSFCISE